MSRPRVPGYSLRTGKNAIRNTLCWQGESIRWTTHSSDMRVALEERRVRYEALRSKDVARQLADLRQAMSRRAAGDSGPRITDLMSDFEKNVLPTLSKGTQRTYGVTLRRLREYFTGERDLAVTEIGRTDLTAYLAWRADRKLRGKRGGEPVSIGRLSNRSVAKDRTVLHTLFAHAQQLEMREDNPVATTKPRRWRKHEPTILRDEEYERLLDVCESEPLLRLYVLVLGEAGLRDESEALWLRWEDLDGQFLKVVSGRNGHHTKNGRSRDVPMTRRLREALAARYQSIGSPACGWIFAHETTARLHKRGDRIVSLRASLHDAKKEARLPSGWRLHDLRHRRVTTWLAAGESAVKVQAAMGHADIRTTMGYYQHTREHLLDLVDD